MNRVVCAVRELKSGQRRRAAVPPCRDTVGSGGEISVWEGRQGSENKGHLLTPARQEASSSSDSVLTMKMPALSQVGPAAALAAPASGGTPVRRFEPQRKWDCVDQACAATDARSRQASCAGKAGLSGLQRTPWVCAARAPVGRGSYWDSPGGWLLLRAVVSVRCPAGTGGNRSPALYRRPGDPQGGYTKGPSAGDLLVRAREACWDAGRGLVSQETGAGARADWQPRGPAEPRAGGPGACW